MAEYIEREAILDLLKNKYQDMSAMPASYYVGFQYALKTIEKIKPAADVVPVKHGRWENANRRPNTYIRRCSHCGGEAYFCGAGCSYKFCPNCGAKMDLEG